MPDSVKKTTRLLQQNENIQDLVQEFDYIDNFDSTATNETTNIVYKFNIYANSIKCWDNTFIIHAGFSLIALFIFVVICFFVEKTYYETKNTSHNISGKSGSKADVFLLINKIITVSLFFIFYEVKNQWILIISIFFLSASTFFIYFNNMPYYNNTLMKAYLIFSGIYFWNTTCLVLGKILESTSFDGCLHLFFIGIPIIILIILTYPVEKMNFLYIVTNKFNKGEDIIKQINYFLLLVDTKDKNRESKIILKGYIQIYEESCNLKECALKRYQSNLEENNLDSPIFLYQHAELMFQNGISKFPNCIAMRINYAFFLFERLNKKQQANIELITAEKYILKLDQQFIIYRFKKFFQEETFDIIDNEENLDIVANLSYRNLSIQFKNNISKIMTIYFDFWSLLLNPSQDLSEDISKLNEYGSRINIFVEEISTVFHKMQKIRYNDQEILRYYADFLNDILNDKEKASQYQKRLNEIENYKIIQNEIDINQKELNLLNLNDDYHYIILSAEPEKFGIITNISLSFCIIIGYTKSELVGKNIDILMPEVYQKYHRNILLEKINEYRKNTMDIIISRKNYRIIFKEFFSFMRSKSRYLVPMNFKVTFFPNEEKNDSNFIGKFNIEKTNIGTLQNLQTCYVLVNKNFIIQNFTANCVSILGLNSSSINNGSVDILKYVKEFQDELVKFDLDDKSVGQIFSLKKEILEKKFTKISPITWKASDNYNRWRNETSKHSDVYSSGISRYGQSNKFIDSFFNLTINKLFISGNFEGYYFKFDSMANDSNLINFMLTGSESNQESNHGSNNSVTSRNKNSRISGGYNNSNHDDIHNTIKIDKKFMPDSNHLFMIDSKKMSYVINPKNVDEMKRNIKNEAMEKIKPEDSHLELNSDSENSYSDSNEYESESNSNESGVKVDNYYKIQKNKQDYYHVDIERIKLFNYNFNKDCLLEIKDSEKTNFDLKKFDNQEIKDPSFNLEKDEKKNKKEKSEKKIESKDENKKEASLIKQIEFALNKQETQPTITRLKIFSFFIFCGLINIGVLFLYFFIESENLFSRDIVLINNSYDIIGNIIYAIFFIRELTLLNNEKYQNIIGDKTNLIGNIFNNLLFEWSKLQDLISEEITLTVNLSEKNQEIFRNSNIYLKMLDDDLSIRNMEMNYKIALLEMNTAIYHIATRPLKLIYGTSKDVFFFIFNTFNSIYDKIFFNKDLYYNEFNYDLDNTNFIFLVILISTAVFVILSYIVIVLLLNAVSRKKESYLEIFFEIGENVIKNNLERCEAFTKKIQMDIVNDDLSKYDESELNIDDVVLQSNNGKSLKSSFKKKQKSTNSREDKIINQKIVFSLLILVLFFVMIYFLYEMQLNNLKIYLNIFDKISEEEAYFLLCFNVIREYLFDYNNTIFGEKTIDFTDKMLYEIYKFKSKNDDFIKEYKKYFPAQFEEEYNEIMDKNICNFAKNIFDLHFNETQVECKNFVSNTTDFGLKIVIANYLEDIRFAKFDFDSLLRNIEEKEIDFEFNNTMYNINKNKNNYTINDPFQIFNSERLKNLNFIFRFLIKPSYQSLTRNLKTSIQSMKDFFNIFMIILLSFYLGMIIFIYLVIWRQFENNLNSKIFKNKNMLTIIPKESLASLSNIHRLIGIEQRVSKKVKSSNIVE